MKEKAETFWTCFILAQTQKPQTPFAQFLLENWSGWNVIILDRICAASWMQQRHDFLLTSSAFTRHHFNYLWAGTPHLINACTFCPGIKLSPLALMEGFSRFFFHICRSNFHRKWSVGGQKPPKERMAHRGENICFSFRRRCYRKTLENKSSKCSSKFTPWEFSLQRQTAPTCWAVLEEIYRNKLTPRLLVWACAQDNGASITKLSLLIENAANSLSACYLGKLKICARGALDSSICWTPSWVWLFGPAAAPLNAESPIHFHLPPDCVYQSLWSESLSHMSKESNSRNNSLDSKGKKVN